MPKYRNTQHALNSKLKYKRFLKKKLAEVENDIVHLTELRRREAIVKSEVKDNDF